MGINDFFGVFLPGRQRGLKSVVTFFQGRRENGQVFELKRSPSIDGRTGKFEVLHKGRFVQHGYRSIRASFLINLLR